MARAFSYVVARDYGFAPNPFYGVLTLATCKQQIRKSANVGDYIIGFANSAHDNKLIYMAKVSRVISFDEYWTDHKYEKKKPVMNGSLKKLYGYNIYHHNTNGEWVQENSHHSNNDGSVNYHNLNRDTGTTDRVLICEEFVYLGESMITVPVEFDNCVYKHRGYKCLNYDNAQKLWDYLHEQYPNGGKIGLPNNFKKFVRYDGIS